MHKVNIISITADETHMLLPIPTVIHRNCITSNEMSKLIECDSVCAHLLLK